MFSHDIVPVQLGTRRLTSWLVVEVACGEVKSRL
jgi:hypothetical protein